MSILRWTGTGSRRSDDAELAARVVDEHWDLLYRSAYFICGDRWMAEDIAQEAAIRAIGALPKFDRTRPIEPWLSRIAANAACDWLRRQARRPEVGLELGGKETEDPTDIAASIARGTVPDQLAEALLNLALPMRTVIVLRHLLDLPTSEIAALLEIEPVTVRTRLHRGLSQLRSALNKEEIGA